MRVFVTEALDLLDGGGNCLASEEEFGTEFKGVLGRIAQFRIDGQQSFPPSPLPPSCRFEALGFGQAMGKQFEIAIVLDAVAYGDEPEGWLGSSEMVQIDQTRGIGPFFR